MMLRFLRYHIQPHYGEFKAEDVHHFYKYKTTARHGFPQNVCSVAHDPVSGIMAIGTRNGEIRIFGAENVEWSCTVPGGCIGVSHMYFVIGYGALLVLCADLSFHKFELSSDSIKRTTACHEERLKRITSCEMLTLNDKSDSRLLVGTVTGNVFALHVDSLELSEVILFEENILQSVAALSDMASRSVDLIVIDSNDTTKLLILFNSVCVVYYDTIKCEVLRVWSHQQPVTFISWTVNENEFVCSHVDGSFDVWCLNSEQPVEPSTILFGPYPCTPITKILCACTISDNRNEMVKLFCGGMPRASYGDRYTLTAMRSSNRVVVLDFASSVVDFFIIPSVCSSTEECDYSKALALVVLCEQELVCIDLADRKWPVFNLPYLNSIHSSTITFVAHHSNISEHVFKAISKGCEIEKKKCASSRSKWPLFAGSNIESPSPCAVNNTQKRQILITGHENGCVKLWCSSSMSLKYLLTVDTAKEFEGYSARDDEVMQDSDGNGYESRGTSLDEDGVESEDDELNTSHEWPPFRKVGVYDPFCDDARLAVQKIHFDANTGRLVVGGRAGHALVYDLEDEPKIIESAERRTYQLVSKELGAAGDMKQKQQQQQQQQQPKALPPRSRSCLSSSTYPVGYQPLTISSDSNRQRSCIIQLEPAVAITGIASLECRNLLALGCEYGFVLCDLKTHSALLTNCLINAEQLAEATALNGALSRFKSMKKSIRQSFRRKKKPAQTNELNATAASNQTDEDEAGCSYDEVKPVERAIVSRSETLPLNAGDPLQSCVRVLKFYHANIISSTSGTDSLWVGTNSGIILVYAIADDAIKPEDVCVLIKEIRLQHRAPIIDLNCVNSDGSSLVKGSSAGAQRLLVCSEEQLKTFSLPLMKAQRFKYKLTATEGSRIRKVELLTLRSLIDRKVYERFVAVITNQGELLLFAAASLKRLAKANFTKVNDVVGISSTVVSQQGELFFLRAGGSEFERASLSAYQQSHFLQQHNF